MEPVMATPTKPPAGPKAPKPVLDHGIEQGDHIYIHHPAHGPMAVRVSAVGRDGITGRCDQGQRHQVAYDRVLGHRARMLQDWRVVDQGADGAILQDHTGKRRFLRGQVPTSTPSSPVRSPASSADDPLTGRLDDLTKAMPASPPAPAPLARPEPCAMKPAPLLFFFKAGTIKDRPGLTLKDTTDKAGHQTKRWTRTMQDQPGSSRPAGAAAAAPAGDKGAAAFRHGDKATFRHGDVEGSGTIVASGQHGVTLQDDQGREHQVRHEHLVRPQDHQEAKPQFPERDPRHTDKEHAKRIARETPDPSHLPEEHEHYFNMDRHTHVVPLDKVKSRKTEAETRQSGANAAKLMHAARHGATGKRDPVQAKMADDGTFHVEDGNSTVAAARKHGWKAIPVTVAGHPTAADKQFAVIPPEETKGLPDTAPQPFEDEASLYEAAAPALEDLRAWLDKGKGVASQLGHKTMTKSPDDVTPEEFAEPGGMLFIAPLKGKARAAEKVRTDYKGDWTQLRDVVRCSLAVDSIDDLRKTLEALKKSGLKLAQQPKDRFVKPVPVGYRDCLMNIVLSNGMIGEVQLHVKPMLAAKIEGHHHYEIERSLEGKVREKAGLGGDDKLSRDLVEKHLDENELKQLDQAKAEQRRIYGEAWARVTGQGGSDMQKAMQQDGKPPEGSPQDGQAQEGGYSYFDHQGAKFRRFNNGLTRGVDDVLAGGKWERYQGADNLYPALFGDEIPDPLGGGQAQPQGGDEQPPQDGQKPAGAAPQAGDERPMRKSVILFARGD